MKQIQHTTPRATHNARDRQGTRDEAYRDTIEQIQKELPRSTRGFSRLIHTSSIEKASDVIASTIARPNALLAGGIAAFMIILAVYSYAKYAGFALQGSETIIAFVLGWALGIVFDIVQRFFVRNRD